MDYSEFLNESYLFSENNFEINLDKWKAGNPLWITGSSGDGKSTFSNQLAKKKNAYLIHLDLFLCRICRPKEKWEKALNSNNGTIMSEGSEMILEYINKHPEIPWFEGTTSNYKNTGKLWNDLFDWIIENAKYNIKYCNKLIIIEGCDICLMSPEKACKLPLIIIGTSRFQASIRRIKRDQKEDNRSLIEDIFREIKRQRTYIKDLDKQKDDFKRNIIKQINEEVDSKKSIYEILFGTIKGSIKLDYENKKMTIVDIDYEKFLLRIKEMYETVGILKLFEKNFTWWSTMMWKKGKINRNERKISSLEVPLFFALEIYKIFMELGEFYNLSYYKKVAKKIYNNTWISNYEKKDLKSLENTNISYLKKLRYTPKDYQLEFIKNYKNLKFIYDLEGYILSFDQGLGKTFTAIALSETLNKDRIIIVCPNSIKENWAYEIKQYYYKYFNDENLWKKSIFINGNPDFRYFGDETKYIIVNQESIQKIFPLVKKSMNYMIVVDESHNFRNLTGTRTENLLRLKEITKCKDNIIMSGTPIKAVPNEITPALLMIDPYFTRELAEMYYKAFNINKTSVANVVKERLNRQMYRKTKKEVLTLPEKHIDDINLKVNNSEKYYVRVIKKQINVLYHEIYEDRIKKDNEKLAENFAYYIKKYCNAEPSVTKRYLDFILTTTNTKKDFEITDYESFNFRKLLKNYVYPNMKDEKEIKELKSVESNYINMVDVCRGEAVGKILPPLRNQAYIDVYEQNKKVFINMIKKNSKKTIIFTQFLEVCNYIENDLKKNDIGVVKIVGGTKDRMSLIQQFKEDDTIDVLIATSQTLSTGVTLTEATQMFFFGVPWRSADYDQACDRIYRIGQTHDVYIYNVYIESDEKNLTNRMKDTLDWSADMFDSMIMNEEWLNESSEETDLQKIKDFYDKIKDFEYGFISNGKRYSGKVLDEQNTFNKYRTMSVKTIKEHRICVCWDAVLYEAYWFKKNVPNIPFKCYYCEYEPNIGNSHTWLVFNYKGENYVFEQSWRKHQGVNKMNKSNKNTINQYIHDIPHDSYNLKNYSDSELESAKYVLFEYNPLAEKTGLDCAEYMDNKWYNGKLIKTNCKDKKELFNIFQFNSKEKEKLENTLNFKESYEPPYSLDEIRRNYGKEYYNRLSKDPIHKWRAETGIELIHKEPTKEELERIMKNWESMDERRKRISDKKSIEVFGCTNSENYNKLINSYDETLETTLTKPFLPKNVQLYHYTRTRYPNDIVDPRFGMINIGTKLSNPRYSSWWCNDPFFPYSLGGYALFKDWLYEYCNKNKELYDTKIKDFLFVNYLEKKIYINESYKFLINWNYNGGDKYYIYSTIVPKNKLGRGHNIEIEEFTIDEPIKASCKQLFLKDLKKYIEFKDGSFIKDLNKKYKDGKHNHTFEPNFMEKMIYYNNADMKKIRKKYKKKYGNIISAEKYYGKK